MKVRTRFAPSPTGYLHVGGARTALFNYLFARKNGGEFILRVEDTDKERNSHEATAAIFSGMKWLGLEWDEGPDVGGACGPYYQSQREDIYLNWFNKLIESGRVYEDDGAWRFKFERKSMTMHDMICGEVTIDYKNVDNTPDMVVRRSDGSFTFHFVNVVDDLEMGVTHVIRGEDHLMNTPKHIQLFEAFGVTPPYYAHLPLILDLEGAKMSKRHAAAAVDSYAPRGFTAESVFNFLALLGWSPKDEEEIFSKEQLINLFDLSGVNRAPAKFDEEKCAWMNQQHLIKLTADEFAAIASVSVKEAGIELGENFTQIVSSVQEKVRTLDEVLPLIKFFYDDNYSFDDEAVAKVKKNVSAVYLLEKLVVSFEGATDWTGAKNLIGETAKSNGAKPGQLMFPTRVALSGMAGGPDLGVILDVLGKKRCVERLKRAIKELN